MTDPTIDKAALEAALDARSEMFPWSMRTILSTHGVTYPSQMDAVATALITAYLAALPSTTDAVGVTARVKPLEWASEPPYSVARVFLLRLLYSTEAIWDDGAFQYVELSGATASGRFATVAEAKAAAQADYTARVMASLNISEAEPVAARRIEVDIGAAIKALEASPELADMMSKLLNPTTSEGVRDDVLATAARELIASRFDTYRAGNNRQVGIQDDNGEKCWIVPFDEMAALEAALKGNRT